MAQSRFFCWRTFHEQPKKARRSAHPRRDRRPDGRGRRAAISGIPDPARPVVSELDFSDLPELIGAFAYGSLAGVAIALLKNVIHLLVSQSGFVGELSNFLLGGVFALTAGLIYRRHKTKKTALLAGRPPRSSWRS